MVVDFIRALGLCVQFSLRIDFYFFFFNDPAPTEIYPLPLPDALPTSRSIHSQTPADVDARAGSSFGQELPNHQVRRVPLADAAGIEPRTGRQGDGRATPVDHDAVGPEPQWGLGLLVIVRQELEAPVVSRAYQRAQDGWVVPAVCDSRSLQRPLHQRQRLLRDTDGPSSQRVQPADLTGRPEATPKGLEPFDPFLRRIEQRRRAVDHDDV